MRFEYRIAQPINLIALSVAAIVIFFGVKYKSDFDNNGYVSKEAITSISFQKYLMACLGGSLAMCYSSAVELLGKYLLNEQVDKKFILEFMLIMTVLLPSICLLGNLELNNAVAFFWPLFHVQIIIIVNVTLLFWANKMGLSKSSPDVLLNSALSCLTFTTHLFVPRASWTSSSTNSVPGLLYMLFFSGAIVSSARTVRLTYCKNTNKNAVVLINTAAAEQQWALLFSLSILLYYIAFLVLEAGVYPHNDHNHLQAGYLSANYVLLSVFALSVLTLHQRKEFYHGIISQVTKFFIIIIIIILLVSSDIDNA